MKRAHIALIVIYIFGFLLRVWFLPAQSLTFGYDQARDAYESLQIADGNLKIYGPPASTPGLFHGVFYYYFLAPAYALGNGSPLVTAYWVAFWNACAVGIVYALAYAFTKKTGAALLSALFFAVSFEATQYATWLSNPTIGVWTVPLIYLGLWRWIHKEKWGNVLAAVALGLSTQGEIFLIYHIVPILIWLYVSRKHISKKSLAVFGLVFLVTISSMIVVELQHFSEALGGAASLASSGDEIVKRRLFGDIIILYFNQIGTTFSNALMPLNIGYGGILGIGLTGWLILQKRQTAKTYIPWQLFLASYLLSHASVVSVGGTSTPFLLVGIGSGATVALGIFAHSLFSRNRLLFLGLTAIIISSNLASIMMKNKDGSVIFSIQKDMTLKHQLAAVDYTYQTSQGNPFSINTLTSPLWVNTVWSYLYNWHGKNTYGYVPSYHGKDQVGRLGNTLTAPQSEVSNFYFISEPWQGIPEQFVKDAYEAEVSKGKLVDSVRFSQIEVQRRTQ